MATVNVHEAKARLSRLLERIQAGELITIARAGKAVADLVPPRSTDIAWGSLAGRISWDADTFDDLAPDVIALVEGTAQ